MNAHGGSVLRVAVLAGLVSVVCGCGPEALPPAQVWSVTNMLGRLGAEQQPDFGGWTPRRLAVPSGERLPFEGVPSSRTGLLLQPGVSAGASAPFLITEIWKNHPVPWVQPVWVPREGGAALTAPTSPLPNVFSVNVDSKFYSPFWRLEQVSLAATEPLTADTFRTARQALAAPHRALGALVYCPVVPAGAELAGAPSSDPKDPMTGAPVKPPPLNPAVVEGKDITYFGIGPGRFDVAEQLPVVSTAYFFVKALGGPVLPVAAVLPDGPKAHSFVQRVDVVLQPAWRVYVPEARPELRALLDEAEVASVVGTGSNAALPRALQVVTNPDCLAPGSSVACQWLDSVAMVESLTTTRMPQNVTLALAVLAP